MKAIEEILAAIGALVIISVVVLSLTSATSAPSYGNLTKVTSRDGITVYKYDNCIIVKTNNSVSITR